MSDLANLIESLEAHLPALRREMAGGNWDAFASLLAEAAPVVEQAASDHDARLEAFYLLQRALGQFEATRRILPLPGGALVQPAPAPASGEPTPGLPTTFPEQKEQDLAKVLKRAAQLCRNPNAAADRLEAAARRGKD